MCWKYNSLYNGSSEIGESFSNFSKGSPIFWRSLEKFGEVWRVWRVFWRKVVGSLVHNHPTSMYKSQHNGTRADLVVYARTWYIKYMHVHREQSQISTQSQQGFVEHTEIQNCLASLRHPLLRRMRSGAAPAPPALKMVMVIVLMQDQMQLKQRRHQHVFEWLGGPGGGMFS
jgi:hypothetical protein